MDLLEDLDPEFPEVAQIWKQIDEWEEDDAEIDAVTRDDFDIDKVFLDFLTERLPTNEQTIYWPMFLKNSRIWTKLPMQFLLG